MSNSLADTQAKTASDFLAALNASSHGLSLLTLTLSVLVVMEIHKVTLAGRKNQNRQLDDNCRF